METILKIPRSCNDKKYFEWSTNHESKYIFLFHLTDLLHTSSTWIVANNKAWRDTIEILISDASVDLENIIDLCQPSKVENFTKFVIDLNSCLQNLLTVWFSTTNYLPNNRITILAMNVNIWNMQQRAFRQWTPVRVLDILLAESNLLLVANKVIQTLFPLPDVS